MTRLHILSLAVAARGGMETLRPALQRVYMTRASAYKDALKSFIQGYQEGIQQTMEKNKDSKSSKDTDASNSIGPTWVLMDNSWVIFCNTAARTCIMSSLVCDNHVNKYHQFSFCT